MGYSFPHLCGCVCSFDRFHVQIHLTWDFTNGSVSRITQGTGLLVAKTWRWFMKREKKKKHTKKPVTLYLFLQNVLVVILALKLQNPLFKRSQTTFTQKTIRDGRSKRKNELTSSCCITNPPCSRFFEVGQTNKKKIKKLNVHCVDTTA